LSTPSPRPPIPRPPPPTPFPSTTLFRSAVGPHKMDRQRGLRRAQSPDMQIMYGHHTGQTGKEALYRIGIDPSRHAVERQVKRVRSEEHTSELQSPDHLVCRLLLEKKTTS